MECNGKYTSITENKYGFYIFLLKVDNIKNSSTFLEDFSKKRVDFKEKTDSKVPRVNKTNFEFYKDKENLIEIGSEYFAILYIGKSENLSYRLILHNTTGNKNTYCLRLADFFKTSNNESYKIKYCFLSTNEKKIFKIVHKIEKN